MLQARINKIINFSNVDGPYNRTSIFFQGCNFNCLFCHNPETINHCSHCGSCVKTCPRDALSIVNGKVVWDEEKCNNCDTCIKTCQRYSSPKIKTMSVKDVLDKIKITAPYIDGITVSGGECMLHHEFLTELFKEVKKINKTCFIDTNGYSDFKKYPELLKYTDKIMLDIKAFDPKFHKWLTNKDNDIVLKNLEYLLAKDKLYEVRTIIFDGLDEANEYTVKNVSKIIGNRCYYKLIKYRPYGVKENNKKIIGFNEVDDDYFKKFIEMANKSGASKIIKV